LTKVRSFPGHSLEISRLTTLDYQAHPSHDPSNVHIFQHDLTEPSTAPSLSARLADVPPEFGQSIDQFDIVSHVFVLSALAPRNHAKAVKTLIAVSLIRFQRFSMQLIIRLYLSFSRLAVLSYSETMLSTTRLNFDSIPYLQHLTLVSLPFSPRKPTLPLQTPPRLNPPLTQLPPKRIDHGTNEEIRR